MEISLNGADWDALEPVELFENQRLFILSGSANHGSRAWPEWPFKASVGLVMLNPPGDTELEFSAEALPSLEVRHNSEAGWTVVRESGTDGACLYLKTTRLLKINTTPAPVVNAEHARIEPHANDWPEKPLAQREPPKPDPVTAETDTRTTDPASSAFDIEPTWVQRASAAANWDTEPTHVRQAPQQESRMALRGLAVQKLSLYTSDGIKGLQWALDARGHLVRADAPGSLHRFDLMPTDELRLLTRNGHRTLKHGDSLPLEAGRTMSHWQPLPDSLSNAYLGWLSLPQSPSASLVVGDEFTVGRMHRSAARPGGVPDRRGSRRSG